MRIARCLAMGTLAVGIVGAGWAQFAGPAPLSWRWAHSTPIAPIGAPLVVGDTVYVAVGNRMFALDRATGNQKWRYPNVEGVAGYFRSSPVFAEGNVIAAADNKFLYAVDAETGQAKWSYPSPVPIVGQPVLVGGSIVVVELNDNTILGIRADNGKPAWTSPAPEEAPLPYKVYDGITGGLAVYGTSILFMTSSGDLTAISSTTRKQLWKARFTTVAADSTPAIFGDVAFVNSGSWLVAVNANTGIGRWQRNTGEQLAFSPAVSADGVFTVTTDGKAMLFDTASGRPKLKQPVDLGAVLAVRPTAVDKLFLAPLTSGALTLVNPADGNVVWSYITRPLTRSAGGTTAGGGGIGGDLAAFRGGQGPAGAGSANSKNDVVIAVPASGPAVLAGQTLLVLMADGSLLAFDKNTGVDKTGPSIKMTWPNSGEQVNGSDLELDFKIDDEATGVNSTTVAVTIDGKAADLAYGRDGFAVVKINVYGKNKPLADGRKAIKVTASDWFGNTTTGEFGLTIDNALPITRPNANANSNRPGGGRGGGGGGRGGGGGGNSGGG